MTLFIIVLISLLLYGVLPFLLISLLFAGLFILGFIMIKKSSSKKSEPSLGLEGKLVEVYKDTEEKKKPLFLEKGRLQQVIGWSLVSLSASLYIWFLLNPTPFYNAFFRLFS